MATYHNIDRIIGKRLREVRTAQSMTIAEMADRSGYSKDAISDAENGKSTYTIQKIIVLAHAYNCPYYYLVKNLPDPVEDKDERSNQLPGQQAFWSRERAISIANEVGGSELVSQIQSGSERSSTDSVLGEI